MFNYKKKTHIMGILNMTPDSFSDGGKYNTIDKAKQHALKMIEDGADIIDIGGESTRPGADPISSEIEINRILPIIKALVKYNIPISIDTYKPEVAEICIKNGAKIINDISGLRHPEMIDIAVKYDVPIIVMHMKGNPQNMQLNPSYNNVVLEIMNQLEKKIKIAEKAGIKKIIIDPGIGFGKRLEDNIEILKKLSEFKKLNKPILIGTSRKGFLGKIINEDNPQNRLEATLATSVISIINGANILRVHDVKETKIVSKVINHIYPLKNNCKN